MPVLSSRKGELPRSVLSASTRRPSARSAGSSPRRVNSIVDRTQARRWPFRAWWSWGESNPRPSAMEARATTIPDSLADAAPAGRLAVGNRRPSLRLCGVSADFPAVSGLSCGHPPLLLPGCGGSAPCAIAGHDVSSLPDRSGGESELLVGNSCCLPRLASLSNSGRTLDQRNRRRNLSAPCLIVLPRVAPDGS